MIYTIEEIKNVITPIAVKYGLRSVYLFGSYARGTATEDSDVDLFIDTTGTSIRTLFDLGAVYCDFEEALGKKIDLITKSSFDQKAMTKADEDFRSEVYRERMNLYAAA